MMKKLALVAGVMLLAAYGLVVLAGVYSLASCRNLLLPENSTLNVSGCGDLNRGWFVLILLLSPSVLMGSLLVGHSLGGLQLRSVRSWLARLVAVASAMVSLVLIGVVLTAAQAAIRSWLWPTSMDIMSRPDIKTALLRSGFFGLMAAVGAGILWSARKLWLQSKDS